MTAVNFPQANRIYGPPEGYAEQQVGTIPAAIVPIQKGTCDGAVLVVVCHQPSDAERAAIAAGAPIYISMLGMLAPHFLTTNFAEATNPA